MHEKQPTSTMGILTARYSSPLETNSSFPTGQNSRQPDAPHQRMQDRFHPHTIYRSFVHALVTKRRPSARKEKTPMNRRLAVVLIASLALAAFAAATYFHTRWRPEAPSIEVKEDRLIRPHSPILGPTSAPVTIVEFFDPSCEACRAFYPTVKEIMATYPQDVRVVIRYADFHPASNEAIRLLEAARKQGKFQRVMEWLLLNQEQWGADGNPNPKRAWEIAGEVGLDVAQAKKDGSTSAVDAVLEQDAADVSAVGVTGTPTFFVNGKPLQNFGKQQLIELVGREVAASK
jgi:thiol-disulfide isomerase/thioredoxin